MYEFGDDLVERIYAKPENGCGDVYLLRLSMTIYFQQMNNTFLLAQQKSARR
jgi:hypothetical protein